MAITFRKAYGTFTHIERAVTVMSTYPFVQRPVAGRPSGPIGETCVCAIRCREQERKEEGK